MSHFPSFEIRRQLDSIYELLLEKDCYPRIPYPAKLSFIQIEIETHMWTYLVSETITVLCNKYTREIKL